MRKVEIFARLAPSRLRKFARFKDAESIDYRILVRQGDLDEARSLHNIVLDFSHCLRYDEVSAEQRVVKIAMSFDSVTGNGGVSHGISFMEDDTVARAEIVSALQTIGAAKQAEIIAAANLDDDDADRPYWDCKPDTCSCAVEYARARLDKFVMVVDPETYAKDGFTTLTL